MNRPIVISTDESTLRTAQADYTRFYAGFAALSRAYRRLKSLAPPAIAQRVEADLRAEFDRIGGGNVDRQRPDQFDGLLDDVLCETARQDCPNNEGSEL